MEEEQWSAKIQTSSGSSALALELGRLLVGGHYGLFAHDLAHITDLKEVPEGVESVQGLNSGQRTGRKMTE